MWGPKRLGSGVCGVRVYRPEELPYVAGWCCALGVQHQGRRGLRFRVYDLRGPFQYVHRVRV